MNQKAGEKISCLCVTEAREAFMPWLIWCFDRQTWDNKELVIIDSSPEPFYSDRDDIRVVPVATGVTVAKKRNMGIDEAAGKIITWFDDDDWQHPDKLKWIAETLSNGSSYTGSSNSWFLNIYTNGCERYHAHARGAIFNSTGFLRKVAKSVLFNNKILKASDTIWMRGIEKRYGFLNNQIIKDKILFFWLCHSNNISNPAKGRCFHRSLLELKKQIGLEAWGNTDDELEELRVRLANGKKPFQVKKKISTPQDNLPNTVYTPVRPIQLIDNTQKLNMENKNELPVGLMIKATVMDAPFLDIMVRHMISQAKYPFAEKVIIVDRKPAFRGKYRVRNRLSNSELDNILEALIADGTIDRVIDVDIHTQRIHEIMSRYFSTAANYIPLHARTGGPIYPTLFGMESLSTDSVLQMDADVFFYTAGISWVKESLQHMARDERLWLMMTHPGPPDGSVGASLGRRNARLAEWDYNLQLWRFQTATTRYFLCNKQKLYGRLRPLRSGSGTAPLEQIIGQALKEHHAYRGALGDLKSWHLHAWHHGDPFPQWAPLLTKAVESGKYPSLQRGQYDLRLDIPGNRNEWEKVLKSNTCNRTVTEKTLCKNSIVSTDKTGKNLSKDFNGHPPIAVIIPIRDRAGQRLRNALASLDWQSTGPPAQILLVSHGSQTKINKELSNICSGNGSKLIKIGEPKEPWNKSFSLNVGIRATNPDISFVMTMDADMILAPNFLSVLMEKLTKTPPNLVLCRSSDLPEKAYLPENEQRLKNEFDKIQRLTKLRPEWGTGGIQAAHRTFFFDVHGYDEDLEWWGAMDKDMVQRAQLAGLKIKWIEDETAMLHQWHLKKHKLLKDKNEISQAKQAWHSNHNLVNDRSTIKIRNLAGWGKINI